MANRLVFKWLPETYTEAAYNFGWHCARIGVGHDGNPFAPGSDEHEAYCEAQDGHEEHERILRESGYLLNEIGRMAKV